MAKKVSVLETEKETFPRKLRGLMDGSPKVSQEELAAYLGVSRQAVGQYRQGRSAPDWKTIVKIADFFDVSTDYLLTDVDSKSKANPMSVLSDTVIKNLNDYYQNVAALSTSGVKRRKREKRDAVNFFLSDAYCVTSFFDAFIRLQKDISFASDLISDAGAEYSSGQYDEQIRDCDVDLYLFSKEAEDIAEKLLHINEIKRLLLETAKKIDEEESALTNESFLFDDIQEDDNSWEANDE